MASAGAASALAVAMRGIDKRFGAVHANRGVDLVVRAGTVHGIVGENGAGKSTLMSILYGLHPADAGTIEVEGRVVRIAGPRAAIALGLGMVHQHFMLVDTLSALDNVLLGAEPHWRLAPARAGLRGQLEGLMRATGLTVRLDEPVAALPVGERQRLEILKALVRGARILILDEPTAVLTPQETEQLFATLRRLRAQGATVLIITHKLKEILALCDQVTVMRQGAVVHDGPVAATSLDGLAEAMVGRRVELGRHADAGGGMEAAAAGALEDEAAAGVADDEAAAGTAGATLLQAEGLAWTDALGVARLTDVSLALREREIVGVAGVSGNGQSELLDVLAGLLAPQRGTLRVAGRSFTPARWLDPATARDLGIAHVPEDRQRRGLVLPFAAWESAVLGYQNRARYGRGGWMRRGAMHEDCAAMMASYDVRPRDPRLGSGRFSGGNQQKLVLAREAWHAPRVLLVGQPTRGVDIGAVEFIHGRLRALRNAGGTVLLVSSELDEILALADRVVVMHAGRVAGELPIGECSEAVLGRLMAGSAPH